MLEVAKTTTPPGTELYAADFSKPLDELGLALSSFDVVMGMWVSKQEKPGTLSASFGGRGGIGTLAGQSQYRCSPSSRPDQIRIKWAYRSF